MRLFRLKSTSWFWVSSNSSIETILWTRDLCTTLPGFFPTPQKSLQIQNPQVTTLDFKMAIYICIYIYIYTHIHVIIFSPFLGGAQRFKPVPGTCCHLQLGPFIAGTAQSQRREAVHFQQPRPGTPSTTWPTQAEVQATKVDKMGIASGVVKHGVLENGPYL